MHYSRIVAISSTIFPNDPADEEEISPYEPIIHTPVKNWDDDIMRFIIPQSFINVNAQNKHRETILHTAVQYNQIECLKVVLSHTDVAANADNAAEETPLHYAVFYVIIDCVKLLVENINTNVWIKDIYK